MCKRKCMLQTSQAKALSISLAMEQLKKQTGSAAYKYRKNPKE